MPGSWFKGPADALENLGYVLLLLLGGIAGLIVGAMAVNFLIYLSAWIFQRLKALVDFIFVGGA